MRGRETNQKEMDDDQRGEANSESIFSAFSLYFFSFLLLCLSGSSECEGDWGEGTLTTSGDPKRSDGASPLDWSDDALWSPTDTADSFDFNEGGMGILLADGVNRPLLDIDDRVAVFAVEWLGVFEELPFLDG